MSKLFESDEGSSKHPLNNVIKGLMVTKSVDSKLPFVYISN